MCAGIAAATILGDGRIALILDADADRRQLPIAPRFLPNLFSQRDDDHVRATEQSQLERARIHHVPHRIAVFLRRYHVGARDPGLDAGDGAAARARLCARRHQSARRRAAGHRSRRAAGLYPRRADAAACHHRRADRASGRRPARRRGLRHHRHAEPTKFSRRPTSAPRRRARSSSASWRSTTA